MMKKAIGISLLGLLPFTWLYSVEFDWGGAIQNITDVSIVNERSITQINSLSLWAEIDVKPMLNFKMGGGYWFKYDDSVSHIPEFGMLYVYGSNDSISYKVGRYTVKDKNKNLFSTILDGAGFGFRNETIEINWGIGFSGLVFNDNSNISMTSSDYDLKQSDDFKLASPRLAEYGEVTFYVLPGDGAVSVAFLAQQDMLSSSQIQSGEGLLHTFYLNAGLKGRLWNSLFYNLYGTGEAGVYDMTKDKRTLILGAGAAGLKVDIPLPLPLNPLVSVDFFYSSGDNWDRTDFQGSAIDGDIDYLFLYTPFSMQNKGYIYSINGGNLIYGDVALSISPVSFFSVVLESLTLFRAVNGPVSTLPVSEADSNSSRYLGEEVTLTVNLKPLSDLGFQLKGGVFIPNDAVVSDGVQFKLGGYLSLSF